MKWFTLYRQPLVVLHTHSYKKLPLVCVFIALINVFDGILLIVKII
jgi:hypothetical protein